MSHRLFSAATAILRCAFPVLLLCGVAGCNPTASTAVLENHSSETVTEVELAVVDEERRVVAVETLEPGESREVTLPSGFGEARLLFSARVGTRPIHADCGYLEAELYRARIEVLPDLTASCVVDLYP